MKLVQLLPLLLCATPVIAADTIQIQSAVIHTTQKLAEASALRDVTAKPGEEVTTQAKDYKVTILPTIVSGDTIHIEATFTEHASATKPEAVKLPPLSTTNGQKASVTVGAFTFAFTPTIKRDQK